MAEPWTEAARALRRWVFNEMGITGEGAWTEEFDRRLAAIEQEAAEPYRRVVEAALLWRKRRRAGVAADGELLAALDNPVVVKDEDDFAATFPHMSGRSDD